MNLPEFTWIYWIYLNLPKFTSIYLILPEFTWIYLNLPEFNWIYLNLPKFIWILDIREVTFVSAHFGQPWGDFCKGPKVKYRVADPSCHPQISLCANIKKMCQNPEKKQSPELATLWNGVHSSFVLYSSEQFALRRKLRATTFNPKTKATSCLLPICLISLVQSLRFWRPTASHYYF